MPGATPPAVALATTLALAAALLPAPLAAQPGSASTTGSASAMIIEPITVRALEDLRFGTLAVGASGSGGTIRVDPATGAVTYGGDLRGVCGTAGCTARPARFGVSGEAGRRYRITAPASATAFAVGGNGASLPVSAITVDAASPPASSDIGTLDESGRDSFRLGGTLAVAPDSQPGIYRAAIAVVVGYD